MELFTATGKLKKSFWQLEMFDVCTTGDTTHIQIFATHVSTYWRVCGKNLHIVSMCAVSPAVSSKTLFQFSCSCEHFH